MKKFKFLALLLPTLMALPALSGCASDNSKIIIRVLHPADYLAENIEADFEKKYPECDLVIQTIETNEMLYSELKMGKANYDVVTVSEYMVQRLANENLVEPFDTGKSEAYETNLSAYLREKLQAIPVKDKSLYDYGKGYMWGTLGIVINPEYKEFVKRGYTTEKILNDFQGEKGWANFWNPDYKGTQSIKDSMRDTFAVGVFKVFEEEFKNKETPYEVRNATFNKHDSETIEKVKQELINLKGNIFGFEVDSGKNDIVTGKIGMNLAWSGDAAFSIDVADEENDTALYYMTPTLGSNIWFDAMAMPVNKDRTPEQRDYAIKFINYLSEAEHVVENMDYTGYTSFMSGDSSKGISNNPIASYVKESFDSPDQENAIDYDISYFFDPNFGKKTSDNFEFKLKVNSDSHEGRKLVAQYPKFEDIDHLYVMEDYGKENGKIVQMWEDIKVSPLPIWVIVVLVSFVVIAFTYLGSYKIIKASRIKKRKALRKE